MKKRQVTAEIHLSADSWIMVDVSADCAFELIIGKPPGFELKASEIDDAIKLLIAAKELREKMLAENGKQ